MDNFKRHKIVILSIWRLIIFILMALTTSRTDKILSTNALSTLLTIFKYSANVKAEMKEQAEKKRSLRRTWGMSLKVMVAKQSLSLKTSNWDLDLDRNSSSDCGQIFCRFSNVLSKKKISTKGRLVCSYAHMTFHMQNKAEYTAFLAYGWAGTVIKMAKTANFRRKIKCFTTLFASLSA